MAKDNELFAYAAENENREVIEELARQLGLRLIYSCPEKPEKPVLKLSGDGLSLYTETMTLYEDYSQLLPRLRTANLQGELLLRAAKIKSLGDCPTAIDATAGLGEDSLLLAAAGFSVKLYEYNPVTAALLQDALRRAAELPELKEIIGRMELFKCDCTVALSALEKVPDLIYLDPMFPARQKSSLVKKKFQLLHQLEQPCRDEEELLKTAIATKARKIIIKRPSKGPYLARVKPSYSIEGNGIRFDCIVQL